MTTKNRNQTDLVLACTLDFDSFLSNDLKLWIKVNFREVSKILAKIQQLYVETVSTILDVLYVEQMQLFSIYSICALTCLKRVVKKTFSTIRV